MSNDPIVDTSTSALTGNAPLDAKWNSELVPIEDKASGQSLIQQLRRDAKMPLSAIKVDSDKRAALMRVTGLI